MMTGFNSFQFDVNRIEALKEAKRVTKNGGLVIIATWGRIKDCEGASAITALKITLPPPPPTIILTAGI
jgi:ubiquinone/menaquinone biosynthesis C-methylase UbiE